mmetsp:Transcript_6545/g.24455  ORF Transcript_6545/g.24455 Transcript_6545/m.24455 type:complete len:249 (-) Transcript_6545:1445-2191(-)
MRERAENFEITRSNSKKTPSQMEGRAPMISPGMPRSWSADMQPQSSDSLRRLNSRQPPQSKISQTSNQTMIVKNSRMQAHSTRIIGMIMPAFKIRFSRPCQDRCTRLSQPTALLQAVMALCSNCITPADPALQLSRLPKLLAPPPVPASHTASSREATSALPFDLGVPTAATAPVPDEAAPAEAPSEETSTLAADASKFRTKWCHLVVESPCTCQRWTRCFTRRSQRPVTRTPKTMVSAEFGNMERSM